MKNYFIIFCLLFSAPLFSQQSIGYAKRLTNNSATNLCRRIVQDTDGNYIFYKATDNPNLGYQHSAIVKLDLSGNVIDSCSMDTILGIANKTGEYIEHLDNHFLFYNTLVNNGKNLMYVREFDKNLNIIFEKIVDTLDTNEYVYKHLINKQGNHIFLSILYNIANSSVLFNLYEVTPNFEVIKKFETNTGEYTSFHRMNLNEIVSDSSYVITTEKYLFKANLALTQLDTIAYTLDFLTYYSLHYCFETKKYSDNTYFGLSYTGGSGYPTSYSYPGVFLLKQNAIAIDSFAFAADAEENRLWYDSQFIDFINPDTLFFTSGSFSIDPLTYENDGFFVTKFNLNHQIYWQRFFGFDFNYNNGTIAATNDGGCILVLEAWDWQTNPSNTWLFDLILLKIDKNGNAPTAISENTKDNKQILVYPNPATDKMYVNTGLYQNLNLLLYNMNGQCVYSGILHVGTNNIDIANLASGIYCYRFTNDGKLLQSGKVIKK